MKDDFRTIKFGIKSTQTFKGTGRLTRIHNEFDTFRLLSETDRLTKLSILRSLSEDLNNFNLDIQNLKFTDTFDENEFEQELSRCDEYSAKIHKCISSL